jgi:hypothetical protein
MRPMIPTLSLALVLVGCSDYDLVRPDKSEPEGEQEVEEDPPSPDPDIAFSPATLDFGGLPKDCFTDWKEVTITNEGEGTLEVTDIAVSGGGRSAFVIDASLPITLEYGEARTFKVRFKPTAWTDYDVAVDITSNDPDEPVVGPDALGFGAEDTMFEESFVQDTFEQVDVLWVVDNSCSMSDDLLIVSQNFSTFIQVFVDLGLDYHMGVITTDMDTPEYSGQLVGPYITPETPDPVGTFINQIDLGSSGSATEVGFEAIQAALTEPVLSGANVGFMREDAALASIVVTDEDNSSFQTAASFVSWYEGLKSDDELTTFSAICEDLFISCSKYATAADATGGITGNIANQADYPAVLEQISLTSAGMTVSFDLTNEPSDLGRMFVEVEGRTVANDVQNGWTYDSADQAVVFHGTAVPEPGESGVISYPVAGECP